MPVAATDPLYVLYTSGTTGKPKGIVRDNGGHAVALLWTMRHIYDTEPGDVYWAASDVGWVVGHSYIVYGPLLLGATTVLYEGKPVGTPDAGAFWRVAAEHGVKALFTAPTAIRAIKKEDPEATHLDRLRPVRRCSTCSRPANGSTPAPTTGRPRSSASRSSTTGGRPRPAGRSPPTRWASSRCRSSPGSATVPMPGYDVRVLRPDGTECDAGEEGAICVKLPLPPGTLPTLWGDDDRYVASYLSAFPGYYLSGDGGYLDEDGYLFVMGRTDDVINVAGHRLSTGSIEAVLATHPAVAECAVIGVADEIKGQVPRGFVVLKAGASADGLADELVAAVRENIGAVASFKRVDVVAALPKTRSGKILRKTMRGIADGRDEPVPSTIEDVGRARRADADPEVVNAGTVPLSVIRTIVECVICGYSTESAEVDCHASLRSEGRSDAAAIAMPATADITAATRRTATSGARPSADSSAAASASRAQPARERQRVVLGAVAVRRRSSPGSPRSRPARRRRGCRPSRCRRCPSATDGDDGGHHGAQHRHQSAGRQDLRRRIVDVADALARSRCGPLSSPSMPLSGRRSYPGDRTRQNVD